MVYMAGDRRVLLFTISWNIFNTDLKTSISSRSLSSIWWISSSPVQHIYNHTDVRVFITERMLLLEPGQMVSISKYRGTTRYRYRTFKVSTYRLTIGWFILNGIPGYRGQFIDLILLYSDFNYFFPNIIYSFSLYKLNLQHEYRVSCIVYQTQFWYRKV